MQVTLIGLPGTLKALQQVSVLLLFVWRGRFQPVGQQGIELLQASRFDHPLQHYPGPACNQRALHRIFKSLRRQRRISGQTAHMFDVLQHLVDGSYLALADEVLLDRLQVKPAILPGHFPVTRAVQIRRHARLLGSAHIVQQLPAPDLAQQKRFKVRHAMVQTIKSFKACCRSPDNCTTCVGRLKPAAFGDQKTIGHSHCPLPPVKRQADAMHIRYELIECRALITHRIVQYGVEDCPVSRTKSVVQMHEPQLGTQHHAPQGG